MAVKVATNEIFENEVMTSSDIVLVDFYADWCGPCKAIAPIMDQISEENPSALIYKVNIDDEGALAERFGVQSIPTLITFKDGEVVDTVVGGKPKAELMKLLGL